MPSELQLSAARMFIRQAVEHGEQHSPDPSTHNGSVLVTADREILFGYNRIPEELGDWVPQERPDKYPFIAHAEVSVVYAAARQGLIVADSDLYCPWAICERCAIACGMAGVGRIWVNKQMLDNTPERWMTQVDQGRQICDDFGVEFHIVDGLDQEAEILMNGEMLKLCQRQN